MNMFRFKRLSQFKSLFNKNIYKASKGKQHFYNCILFLFNIRNRKVEAISDK